MRLIKAEKEHLGYLKGLYREAFPREERKPFWLIRRKVRQGVMGLWLLEEDGPAGMASAIFAGERVLLDYFAIDARRRGQGLGSRALAELQGFCQGRTLLLEIEALEAGAQNYDQRVRRKRFYLKNGMEETGLVCSVFGNRMELLCWNCDTGIPFEEYREIYRVGLGGLAARQVRRISQT